MTNTFKVQLCQSIFKAKLAVPLVLGVPEIVYVKLPEPLANVPTIRVAVNPVTPVEDKVCPLCIPPFPPVYGTLELTPLAAVPAVKVPEFVAKEQVSSVIDPDKASTLNVIGLASANY